MRLQGGGASGLGAGAGPGTGVPHAPEPDCAAEIPPAALRRRADLVRALPAGAVLGPGYTLAEGRAGPSTVCAGATCRRCVVS